MIIDPCIPIALHTFVKGITFLEMASFQLPSPSPSLSFAPANQRLLDIVRLRRHLFRAELPEDGNVAEHIRTLRDYQSALSILGHTLEPAAFADALLASLPDSWTSFIASLDHSVPDPDSKILIARILAEDQCRATYRPRSHDHRTRRTCYNCRGRGHVSRDCPSDRDVAGISFDVPPEEFDEELSDLDEDFGF